MYTNHRHYILLLLAVLAVGASIFGYITLWNTVNFQAGESTRITAETALANEQKKLQQDTASVYTQSEATRNSVRKIIVSQEKIADFLDTVEKVGTDSGAPIEVSGIDTGEWSGGDSIGHFTAHLTSKGSWSDIMQAMTLIEHLPYSISLNNVRLGRVGDKVVSWTMSADMRVLTTR